MNAETVLSNLNTGIGLIHGILVENCATAMQLFLCKYPALNKASKCLLIIWAQCRIVDILIPSIFCKLKKNNLLKTILNLNVKK